MYVSVEVWTIAAVSVALYHVVEKPMIDMGARLAARVELRALAHAPEGVRNSL